MTADLPYQSCAEIDAVQEAKFAEMLDLCFTRHPYYRQVFSDIGLKREDIGGLADIGKIPLIAKVDYAADPEIFRLETEGLPEEAQVGFDVMHTTGTSGGKPTPFYSTVHDFYRILTANRRALEIRGVHETDLVANLCPMTLYPYGAFHRTIAAANAMKIPVVSPMPGRPSPDFHHASSLDEVIRTVEHHRATILWGVTSYVRRVLMRAGEMGADLSAVRLAFVTGEAVTDAMRADLTRRMVDLGANDPWVSISYAATEMQVGSVECCPGSGYHNPAPDQFHFQVVDPVTHEALPDGETGLAVLTHLDRRGTVLLRYALGDMTALTRAPCPHCGAETDRFIALPSRADDLVKVKGMLIDPGHVAEVLIADGRVEEFQIVIDRENPDDALSMDVMRLRLAPKAGADPGAALCDAVKSAVGVRPEIDIVAMQDIYDPDASLKAPRFIDKRKETKP